MPIRISHIPVCLALLLAIGVAGCTHQDVASGLQNQVQPFVQARAQAIAIVANAKQQVDPGSINYVNVKYSALQEQANNFVGLLVEALDTTSFDSGKSEMDATELTKAIDGFNGSVEPLVKPKTAGAAQGVPSAPPPLPNQWVDSFRASLAAYWSQNQARVARMSLDQRTALGEQIKAQLSWPNFQDIALEKLQTPASGTIRDSGFDFDGGQNREYFRILS